MKLFIFSALPFLLANCHEERQVDASIALEEMSRRIDDLDDQVKDSESKIVELEVKIAILESLEERRGLNQVSFKTCEEIQAFDPALPDGVYRIDPDGPNVGDDPISIYCEMATGSTIISHDSEEPIEVNCTGRGCFRKQIDYAVPMRQIIALTRLSRECHQNFELQYRCQADDLMLVESSWWQDRYNTSRPLANCHHRAEPDFACSASRCSQFDNSAVVPVTGLNVGTARVVENPEILRIRAAVGPLTCSGSVFEPNDPVASRNPMCPNDIGPDSHCFDTLSGCYCLNQVKRNWTEASDFCRSKGMHLVAIESEEEQNTLAHLLVSFDYNWWWTSGSDKHSEGQWLWTPGSKPVTYTNWGSNEPDGDSGENYIQMTRDWGYRWGDYSDGDQDNSICEL